MNTTLIGGFSKWGNEMPFMASLDLGWTFMDCPSTFRGNMNPWIRGLVDWWIRGFIDCFMDSEILALRTLLGDGSGDGIGVGGWYLTCLRCWA
jgi:hypothetical protein